MQVLIEKALDRLDPEERTALEQRLAAVEVLEKELGDRRYRLETLIRHLPEPVVLTDLRGIIVAANEHALSLLGRTVAEAIERGGVEFSDLISSEDLSFERSLPELIRTSRHLQAEYTLRRGDGTCFTAELNLESVKGLDDRPEFLVRVLRDVTEKTWVREKLHQLETSYEAIAQLSNSAILLADESGRLLSWNKGAEAVFRYLAEEILGHPIQELISPRYFEVHAERFARLFAHGSTVESEKDLEVEGLRKGGEEFPMELSIVAWRSGDERYFSAILRDITNYKQTQVKLIELTELLTMEKAALNEKNIALKEILGQIEHDRKEFTLQLSSAVRRTVLPVIDRLEVIATSIERDYLAVIRNNLLEIIDFPEDTQTTLYAVLAPREIEVCNLVARGMSSKEIAALMRLSPGTVNVYRKRIRQKLGLTSQGESLSRYLQRQQLQRRGQEKTSRVQEVSRK
ncbi:MAG: hypothetical protein A2284_04510 [Deltaproteobacteria bacterium RIFOXYA12_FULL_61_11]|nr:MAG: hypothetical protein A2284_04510 [Deltaproteobacteria bacterium RIFOXYA12_FULL_61_11]